MLKNIKLLSASSLAFLGSLPLISPAISYAEGCAPSSTNCTTDTIGAGGSMGQIQLHYNFGFGSINQALNTIISMVFLLAGLAAFVYILLGAFNYLTAGDDSGKTDKARKQITNAVVGLILVALVYVIWLLAINLIPGLSDFFKAS